ncbi:hypothetical protein EMIT036CA2_40343 [Chryseobacterium sp. IT-36CA2]
MLFSYFIGHRIGHFLNKFVRAFVLTNANLYFFSQINSTYMSFFVI